MRGRMVHKKAKREGEPVEKDGQDYGNYDEGECIRSPSLLAFLWTILPRISIPSLRTLSTSSSLTLRINVSVRRRGLDSGSNCSITLTGCRNKGGGASRPY
jgi:hypothetical protein